MFSESWFYKALSLGVGHLHVIIEKAPWYSKKRFRKIQMLIRVIGTMNDIGDEWHKKINPKDARAWRGQGEFFFYQEKYDLAIMCFDKAIKINPEDALAWARRGHAVDALKILKEKGEYKETNDFSLNNNEENHKNGVIFEQCVIDLFDPSTFSLYDCTRDNSKQFNRKVESDQNPDITMRYIRTNELFSIECKFRSSGQDDKVSWARSDQIINYLSYALKNKRAVFVVIGLGGSPNNPDRMFCVPIAEAKYPELFISMLSKFERNPSQMFFWKNGTLS